jgi:hypothetical protein
MFPYYWFKFLCSFGKANGNLSLVFATVKDFYQIFGLLLVSSTEADCSIGTWAF